METYPNPKSQQKKDFQGKVKQKKKGEIFQERM
jgi:hypothetical protein